MMNENVTSQKRANFSSLNGIHKQSTAGSLKGGTGKKLTIKNFKGKIALFLCLNCHIFKYIFSNLY